ncbi:DUF1405 domain-containing protein [Fictibacillus sp. WQ 8-8]|uniref:DUF1405 domain-containing protein n=1 Tax=unclassified Fictibacillus TaxID=2644029 RepID=UPI0007826919|nr:MULTISPECIES: DUF1405 domain-containing protein [unclassified Fictibacillus]MCQ6266013.1 DUF1405 domain-containing protein [Fictibacillus sp. WQ 8-8]MED2972767.1 DUF1405 domain-containing protein [Fictibacillus sp. B-59209]SFD74021.1 Uncharacterized membrane protein YpjA [Bacillus sp. OV194]
MIYLYGILKQKWFLSSLLIINILGTAYGYYWYKDQLAETPLKFVLFVPDSPTASLFFVFVLIAFLFGKNLPYIEALAAVSLFKYGIWAVGMNIAGGVVDPPMYWANYMLIVSHLGMAIEGLLYTPYYRIQLRHLAVAGLWVFHNEIIDYVYGMMPRYDVLWEHMQLIGYLTFWLSVVSVVLVYYLTREKPAHSGK